ncbi:MAG: rhomboid family intramembrane serine protease [Bacteroidales bacterium]|jgi:membrane associated rhomboid family serine protease|nr:rhomboid family intramembrane serine protease [Bacteroidales bacterium]
MYKNNYNRRNYGVKDFFKSKSALSTLILINIIIWLIIALIDVFCFLFNKSSPLAAANISNNSMQWLALPSDLNSLLHKPWTIITYMFVHSNFFHIFFNMFTLFYAGKLFMTYFRKNQLLWTYFFGGIIGAAFFIGAMNIFPVFIEQNTNFHLIGASAAVLAILVTIATYIPNLEINLWLLGRVKLKYLALILILIDVLSISAGNAGGHFSHLGGMLYGFCYGFYLRRNHNRHLSSFFQRLSNRFKNLKKDRNYKNQVREEKKKSEENQQNIDNILAKVSKSGYGSLTKEEKDLLFSKSKK